MSSVNDSTKRLISPVADNRDKQRTYKEQIGRYNQAMRYGFYLQAMMIDYAVIEDRLRSLLYHMGFLANRTAVNVWKRTRPYLAEMVEKHKTDNENSQLGIKNISGKIKLVRCVLQWTQEENAAHGDKFLTALKYQCEGIDIDAVLSVLQRVTTWCRYRNEVVHGLMNKNLDSLDKELEPRAEAGMLLARELDKEIKALKRGNKIRRCLNLPPN